MDTLKLSFIFIILCHCVLFSLSILLHELGVPTINGCACVRVFSTLCDVSMWRGYYHDHCVDNDPSLCVPKECGKELPHQHKHVIHSVVQGDTPLFTTFQDFDISSKFNFTISFHVVAVFSLLPLNLGTSSGFNPSAIENYGNLFVCFECLCKD